MTIKDVKRELIVWAAVLLSAAYSAVVAAKPMDFEESKKIPRLKEILASVSSHGRINVSECRDIENPSHAAMASLFRWQHGLLLKAKTARRIFTRGLRQMESVEI